MRPGRYAAADGSFGRSAGAAMGRGILLLGLALALGIVLLNATDDQPPGTSVAAGTSSDAGEGTDSKPSGSTTTAPTTTAAPARQPKDVKVIVANASSVDRAAGAAKDKLVQAQFNALAPTNAAKTDTTGVYFTAGFEREAAAVAAALGLPNDVVKALPTPPPITDLKTANVVVILGADHAARFGTASASTTAPAGATTTAKPATGATTTTAKPAATTTTAR